MDADFWLERWKNNQIGFNQQQPNAYLLKYCSYLNLKPGANIFVPLCGKSIDMLWLSHQGYHIFGIELSLQACQLFFTENDLLFSQKEEGPFKIFFNDNITLFSGDLFDLDKTLLGNIDAIYDRAALEALPSRLRTSYAQKLISLSAPHTKQLLIAGNYDQSEMSGPPFSIEASEVHQLYDNHFKVNKLCLEAISEIPLHLQAKGLKKAYRHVFLMQPKDQSIDI